mgnify:CR=1 FL=1
MVYSTADAVYNNYMNDATNLLDEIALVRQLAVQCHCDAARRNTTYAKRLVEHGELVAARAALNAASAALDAM